MLIKGGNLFTSTLEVGRGSSTIIKLMRKFYPESKLLIGDKYKISLYGKKGLDLKGVCYNLVELYSRDSTDAKKIRGVHGTPTKGKRECVWVGAGGKVGKSAYKINVSVYFSDYMPFFIRDAGTDPLN